MSAVRDLLNRLTEIGATLEPTGDHLILRAGATPVPAELVRRLRQSKRDLLEELNPARYSANPANQDKTDDAAWWRDRYAALVRWFHVDRRWVEVEAIAYGELLDEWHKSRGRRWPVWQCAGCDEPIVSAAARRRKPRPLRRGARMLNPLRPSVARRGGCRAPGARV
jgi:hypothetical protein